MKLYLSHSGGDNSIGEWWIVEPRDGDPEGLARQLESLRRAHRQIIEVEIGRKPGPATRFILRRRQKVLTKHRDRLYEVIERYRDRDGVDPEQVSRWRADLLAVDTRLGEVEEKLRR